MDEVRKPSKSVIHHRQYHLESINFMFYMKERELFLNVLIVTYYLEPRVQDNIHLHVTANAEDTVISDVLMLRR
jgi:hypothetical protein